MSEAAKAYAAFKKQTRVTSLDRFLAERGVYSDENFDDLSTMWTFGDNSVIRSTEENFVISAGAK